MRAPIRYNGDLAPRAALNSAHNMSNIELSLVMPVYNEAHLIRDSLGSLLAFAASLDLEFEVLVVDDGSTDGSGLALAGLAREQPRLHVLERQINEGKGSALQLGVLSAAGQVIVTLDSDLSTSLEALPPMLEAIAAGSAVVIGDRRHPQSQLLIAQPFLRQLLGNLFSGLSRALVWGAVRDFTCGFKGYRRDAARELFENLRVARWAFDVELLAIARQRGMRVTSIPVQWIHRSDTRVRLPWDGFRALVDLMRIAWRVRTGGYRS